MLLEKRIEITNFKDTFATLVSRWPDQPGRAIRAGKSALRQAQCGVQPYSTNVE